MKIRMANFISGLIGIDDELLAAFSRSACRIMASRHLQMGGQGKRLQTMMPIHITIEK